MAYDRNKIFEQAKDVIKKNKLFFVEDVVSYLPCSKQTFYEFFPVQSDEMDSIKELLEQNRTEIKVSMRSKWYKSDAPALQMALYKLIADENELIRLSVFKNETSGDNKTLNVKINYTD